MISYNLHNPSKSLADRLYTAEFDDALVDQMAWKNIRYEGCKVKTKTLNKYTPKEVASNANTGIGFAFITQGGLGIAGGNNIGNGMVVGGNGVSCFTVGGYYTSAGSGNNPPQNQPGVFQVNNFPPKVLWEGDTINPGGLVSNLKSLNDKGGSNLNEVLRGITEELTGRGKDLNAFNKQDFIMVNNYLKDIKTGNFFQRLWGHKDPIIE